MAARLLRRKLLQKRDKQKNNAERYADLERETWDRFSAQSDYISELGSASRPTPPRRLPDRTRFDKVNSMASDVVALDAQHHHKSSAHESMNVQLAYENPVNNPLVDVPRDNNPSADKSMSVQLAFGGLTSDPWTAQQVTKPLENGNVLVGNIHSISQPRADGGTTLPLGHQIQRQSIQHPRDQSRYLHLIVPAANFVGHDGAESLSRASNELIPRREGEANDAFVVALESHQTVVQDEKCVVCDIPLTNWIRPMRHVTKECTHPNNMCLDCISKWLTAQSDTKLWNQISCPYENCHAPLNHADMREFSSDATFKRYEQLMNMEAISSMPGFRYCRKGCGAGQIHSAQEAEPIVTCVGCGHRTCWIHEMDWHEDQTCEQYDQARQALAQRRKDEEASQKTIASSTKRCPNANCARPIQKNGGCQHMTCSMCRHQFCWDCLRDWSNIKSLGNTHHDRNCPWHSDNLPNYNGP